MYVFTCAQKLTNNQLNLPHATEQKKVMKKLTRMWGDAQRNGRPAEYTWRLLQNLDNSITCIPRRKLWLTPTARVPCSNAANIECKTLTQNEFCRWQNSVRGQEPPKIYIHSEPEKTWQFIFDYNFG